MAILLTAAAFGNEETTLECLMTCPSSEDGPNEEHEDTFSAFEHIIEAHGLERYIHVAVGAGHTPFLSGETPEGRGFQIFCLGEELILTLSGEKDQLLGLDELKPTILDLFGE